MKTRGEKLRLSLRRSLRLKGAFRGLVFASVSVPSGLPFPIKSPGENPKPTLLIARGVLGKTGRCGFASSGRRAFVGLRRGSGFRLAGSAKLETRRRFPETAPKPLSFPAASSPCENSRRRPFPCGGLAAPFFFSRVPGFLCVRPLGEPYIAGSGIALPSKKNRRAVAAAPFFFRAFA